MVIELKTQAELDGLREAGAVVAAALGAVVRAARVGTRADELDELARSVLDEAGAVPLDRRAGSPPLPGAISCSVNDVVVGGRPGRRRLVSGDVLSLACALRLQGWCSSAAVSVVVGRAGEADAALLSTTGQALQDGIAAAQPGGRLGDVAHAVGVVGRSAGYGIPARLGRDRQEAVLVANDGAAGRGAPLRPGLVLAIGPVFLAGGRDRVRTDAEGSAVRTDDGSRAAHVEHTVAITEQGPRVLTLP